MRSRLWAAGAAAWAVAFIVLAYVRFAPQPWYVAIVGVAGLLALSAAILGTTRRGRIALLFAAGILVIAALLGGFTGGPVLLPAVVATVLAVKTSPPDGERPGEPDRPSHRAVG